MIDELHADIDKAAKALAEAWRLHANAELVKRDGAWVVSSAYAEAKQDFQKAVAALEKHHFHAVNGEPK